MLGSHIADFPLFSPRIVKLAAHACEYNFGSSSPTRASCVILGCLRHCYSPGTPPLTPRRAPRCPTEAVRRRSGAAWYVAVGGARQERVTIDTAREEAHMLSECQWALTHRMLRREH